MNVYRRLVVSAACCFFFDSSELLVSKGVKMNSIPLIFLAKLSIAIFNQRTNGPVNAHLRSGICKLS